MWLKGTICLNVAIRPKNQSFGTTMKGKKGLLLIRKKATFASDNPAARPINQLFVTFLMEFSFL